MEGVLPSHWLIEKVSHQGHCLSAAPEGDPHQQRDINDGETMPSDLIPL